MVNTTNYRTWMIMCFVFNKPLRVYKVIHLVLYFNFLVIGTLRSNFSHPITTLNNEYGSSKSTPRGWIICRIYEYNRSVYLFDFTNHRHK